MHVDHWIRQTIRGAGICAWATAALMAVPFGLAGLAIGGGESAVEMSAGAVVAGGLFFGPVIGGAVWAARAREGAWPEIPRAACAGAVWGGLGAMAVWGIDQMVGQTASDPIMVAAGGAIFGVVVGVVCGGIVTYIRRGRLA